MIRLTIIACFMAIGLFLAGYADRQEEIRQERQYCEMVRLWLTDKMRGVPTHSRRGWPPYDGVDQCKSSGPRVNSLFVSNADLSIHSSDGDLPG